MIDASIAPNRADTRTKHRLDELVRDEGYVAEYFSDALELEEGATWRPRRGRPRRSR